MPETCCAIRTGRTSCRRRRSRPFSAAGIGPLNKEVKTRGGGSLQPAVDLRKLRARHDPDEEVVVMCQIGVRVPETATVLRDPGFKDVEVYGPSWLGYAGAPSAPANNETYLNVGALNGRIASLQGRIEELEAELDKMKKRSKTTPSLATGWGGWRAGRAAGGGKRRVIRLSSAMQQNCVGRIRRRPP
jgi:rhodanese-related sulfurtransferase